MKKYLILAVAAMMCMACNQQNDPDVPNNKITEAVSTKATTLLGQKEAVVDQQLLAAGFVKVDYKDFKLPGRNHVKSDAEKTIEKEYLYGFEYGDNEEQTLQSYYAALKKGTMVVEAYAKYSLEGKLLSMSTVFALPVYAKTNGLHADICDRIYNSLPSNAERMDWEASILHGEDETIYKSHAEYIAAVRAEGPCNAGEGAECHMPEGKPSYAYSCMMHHPTPAEAQEGLQEEGVVYGTVTVFVGNPAKW